MVVLPSPAKSGRATIAQPWGTTIFYFFNYSRGMLLTVSLSVLKEIWRQLFPS
jgi:hypothetical protein